MTLWKVLAGVLVTLIVLILLLISGPGLSLAVWYANSQVEGLEVQDASGGLWSDISFAKIHWQSDTLDAQVQRLSLNIDWSCAIALSACLDKVSAESLRVHVSPGPEQPQTTPSTGPVQLPIAVSVRDLQLGRTDIHIEQQIHLRWSQLSSAISMHDTLEVGHLYLQDIQVTLPQPPVTPDDDTSNWIAQISQWQYAPPQFPPLTMPVISVINDVQLRGLTVAQADVSLLSASSITLNAATTHDGLSVDALKVNTESGTLTGELQLDEDYRHALNLQLAGVKAMNAQWQASIKSRGPLDQIAAQFALDSDDGRQALSGEMSVNLLSPQLPAEVQLKWQNLKLPLNEDSVVTADGELSLSGELSEYTVTGDIEARHPNYPDASLNIAAEASPRDIRLQHLRVISDAGQLKVSGIASLAEQIQWQLDLVIEDFQPEQVRADLEGQLSATASTRGTLTHTHDINATVALDSQGQWRDYPAHLSAAVDYTSEAGLDISQFTFDVADNKIIVSGNVSDQQTLAINADVNLIALDRLLPELGGQLVASLSVTGPVSEPEVNWELNADALYAFGVSLSTLDSRGDLVWAEAPELTSNTQGEGLNYADWRFDTIDIQVQGLPTDHKVVWQLHGQNLSFENEIQGALSANRWDGTLQKVEAHMADQTLSLATDAVTVSADWKSMQYQVAAHCWDLTRGQACVDQLAFKDKLLRFAITLDQINPIEIVTTAIPNMQRMALSEGVNGRISGQWRLGQLPVSEFSVTLPAQRFEIPARSFDIAIDSLLVKGKSSASGATATMALKSADLGQLDVALDAQGPLDAPQLTLALQSKNISLSPFAGFTEIEDDIRGWINSDLTVTYASQLWQVEGRAALEEGWVESPDIPFTLTDIRQTLVFGGTSAEVSGQFKTETGEGEINGEVHWQPQLRADFNVQGDRWQYDDLQNIKAIFSPDINISFAQQVVKVTGSLPVNSANIILDSLPESAVSPSGDTRIVTNAPDDNDDTDITLDMSLNVQLDPAREGNVKVEAFGLETALEGDLQLFTRDGQMLALGDVNLVNGIYEAYGQNLQIRQGSALFTGPLTSPTLSVEAIRRPSLTADDVVAGLRVDGKPDTARVTVFAEPAMSEGEALSYLVRGRGLGSQSEDEKVMLSNALLGLGIGRGENSISRLGAKVGVEDLALDTSGQGEETKLAISGTVAPGVKISYGVGVFDSASEITLRYQILPQFYMEAVSGINSAIDLFYQLTFDRDDPSSEKD